MVVPVLAKAKANYHSVTNMLIRVHGERADVESYFHVVQRETDADGVDYDYEAGGRDVDVFEKARRRVADRAAAHRPRLVPGDLRHR